ncbi:MAG: DUF1080 domain-containing protein [Bacteroidota bacterium]
MKNNIIFIILILSVITIAASCNKTREKSTEMSTKSETLSQKDINEEWEILFDGKTSKGWRGYGKEIFPEKGWVIEDGTLHVQGSGKGEAGGGGDIIAVNKYKNFELSLEWKVSEGGNSGIFYLAREKSGQPIWKSAPEMQILDNEKHPDGKLGKDGNRRAGALYDLIPARPETVNPVGEWNHIKIMVYKGTVVHWMNGENILEYHLWTDDWKEMVGNSKFKDYPDFVNPAVEGYIGLQDHGDDVWFRNIKIRKM